MSQPRATPCPHCGAPVDPEARICGYCRAPVATVRCGHCFHMSLPTTPHCTGCGRELGLEPMGRPDSVRCPTCDIALEAFEGNPGVLRDCARCGGQFVEHALLRDLIERRELYGALAPRRPRRRNPLISPVQYRACPACGDLMHRRNFGGSSGIIVDTCSAHGSWFDRGELPGVLAFVESGGLAAARHRELEALERRRRDTATSGGMASSALPILQAETGVFGDVAEAVVELLDAVVDAIWSEVD